MYGEIGSPCRQPLCHMAILQDTRLRTALKYFNPAGGSKIEIVKCFKNEFLRYLFSYLLTS